MASTLRMPQFPQIRKGTNTMQLQLIAEVRSLPVWEGEPDPPCSGCPSRRRNHLWSHASPPCCFEGWPSSSQSHFALTSRSSACRRPAPRASQEGGSTNGPSLMIEEDQDGLVELAWNPWGWGRQSWSQHGGMKGNMSPQLSQIQFPSAERLSSRESGTA